MDELFQSNDPQRMYEYLACIIASNIQSVGAWHLDAPEDWLLIRKKYGFKLKSTPMESLEKEEVHEQNVFRKILTTVIALFHAAGQSVSDARVMQPALTLPNYTADVGTEEHISWASNWIDQVLGAGYDLELITRPANVLGLLPHENSTECRFRLTAVPRRPEGEPHTSSTGGSFAHFGLYKNSLFRGGDWVLNVFDY